MGLAPIGRVVSLVLLVLLSFGNAAGSAYKIVGCLECSSKDADQCVRCIDNESWSLIDGDCGK